MPNVTLAPDVYCVGVNDPGLTVFDIVIPTEYGTTYNSYLVKGKEKTALIDCVKRPFVGEFFRRIEEILRWRRSTTWSSIIPNPTMRGDRRSA